MLSSNRVEKKIRQGDSHETICREVKPLVPLRGGSITCHEFYFGIEETCANEATHVMIVKIELDPEIYPDFEEGDDNTEVLLEPYCDDCGLPSLVDWDEEPIKLPSDWWGER